MSEVLVTPGPPLHVDRQNYWAIYKQSEVMSRKLFVP